MAHAYVLYYFMLMITKLVKIAIDLGQLHVLVKVVFQIFHRSSLARRICQTGFHKLAEHFVINPVETNPVKRAIQNQVTSVEKDIAHIGQYTTDFITLTVTRITFLAEKVKLRMAA